MAAKSTKREFLVRAYSEPHRHYHNLAHVHDCLNYLATLRDLSSRERQTLEHAIWWHDAIYEPSRNDNEERSADLCRQALAEEGVGQQVRDEAVRLILLTKHHRVQPDDRLGALMVSIDLSILGRPPAEYDAYVEAIREEYRHVPDEAFNAGRRLVLEKFLNTAAIYPHPIFRTRYEDQARSNIRRELDARSSG